MLFHLGCAGRRFKTAPTENLGEHLGRLLSDADQMISADEGQRVGSKSTFHRALAERLNEDQSVLQNSATSEVIAHANSVAARAAFDTRNDLCQRNWDAACPDGWRGFGEVCQAPTSYGGACASMQSFAGWTFSDKHKYSESCSAPWPCQDECALGRDYDSACPTGWANMGGGFCKSNESPSSSCPSTYKFDDMGNVQMQILAATCNVSWPCRKLCEEDYGRACPAGWNEIPAASGVCVAPLTYAGGCAFTVNTSGMVEHQKRKFAAECFVTYPCAKPGRSVEAGESFDSLDGPVESRISESSS